MIRARHAALLVPMLLLACPAPTLAKAKVKSAKPKVAHTTAATACTDFFAEANGAWLKAHPAPETGAVSAFDLLRATARERERSLLDELARSATDDAGRALGTLWREGMDEGAVNAAGTRPLQSVFARIGAIRKSRDVAAAIAELHASGLPVLFNFAADRDGADADLRIGYASQGGLGLPDPAYYTRTDAETRDVLGRYRAYIQTILQLSGTPADQLTTQSGWVLSLEMQLASASLPLPQQRDPGSAYRLQKVADLGRAYPRLGLPAFLKAQKVGGDSISLANTSFFTAADGLVASVPVEQWQAYLRFHVASAMAPYLSRAFQDAHEQMYGRLLAGSSQPPARAEQVMRAIDRGLGPVLGAIFAQRDLPAATRAAAGQVADGLRAAMKAAISGNAWMDDATRTAAQAKLDRLRIEIGAPDTVPALAGLTLGQGYGADMLAVAGWKHRLEMAGIGQRGGGDWPQPAQVPDLSYDLLDNRLVITAALLQAPVLDPAMSPAQRYGALGTLIGHALHNAIGGKGRALDATGAMRDWWSPQTQAAFEQRSAPIVAQYDGYVIDATTRVDGRRTRDENLADLGGVELAWAALRAAEPQPVQGDARAFFTAYAQVWARHSTAANMAAWAAGAWQAPAKFRVNGVLSRFPEFATAYACRAGQPMHESQPLSIWR